MGGDPGRQAAALARWFGLPPDDDEDAERFRPTFRSLFSFAARHQENGGFQNPVQHSTMQRMQRRRGTCSVSGSIDAVDRCMRLPVSARRRTASSPVRVTASPVRTRRAG